MGPRLSQPDIFLCHSSKDKTFVRRLARDLRALCVYAWYDEWELLPGDSLHARIGEALQNARHIGVVLSPDSVSSRWCTSELYEALSREKSGKPGLVIPLKYRHVTLPPFLKDKLYLDFSEKYYLPLGELVCTVLRINRERTMEVLLRADPIDMDGLRNSLSEIGWQEIHLVDPDIFSQLKQVLKLSGLELPQDLFEVIIKTRTGNTRRYLY